MDCKAVAKTQRNLTACVKILDVFSGTYSQT
jgi:hypothetical protein